MKLETIFNKVKSILEADDVLKVYIKKVYSGTRSDVPTSNFPCIFLEPTNAPERDVTMPHGIEIGFGMTIFAYIKVMDIDKQIVGDATTKGILDVNYDIKKALGAYVDLDGTCVTYSLPNTRFEFENYPFRGVEIDMDIMLKQNFVTRA
jgi:hypothetical protein